MGYKFSDRYFLVNIEDKNYSAPISTKLIEAVKTSSAEFIRLKDEKCESEEIICKAVDEALDKILGAGTAAGIFEGRELNAYERTDVMTYVLNEVTKCINRYADSRAGASYVSGGGKNHHRR